VVKRTTVYKRKDGWYLHPRSHTTAGWWLTAPPFIRLAADGPAADVGNAVLRGLEASRDNIPPPASWDGLSKPMLELAGVKSAGKFMKGSLCLGIEDDGEWLNFEPTKNQGPRRGCTPLVEKNFRIPHGATAEEIGNAVQRAIELCE
jgi:hypothetical protein